jgi:hypothetical protein
MPNFGGKKRALMIMINYSGKTPHFNIEFRDLLDGNF